MNALDRLAGLLRANVGVGRRPLPEDTSIDLVIAGLERQVKTGTPAAVPEDLQQAAVLRFWDTQRFDNLKDARLVSFGLCVPSRPSGPCIMEDRHRFRAVLDHRTGVDQWINDPHWYRRCYQGLVRSYFTYDPQAEQAPAVGRQNWGDLRDYLSERTRNIADKKLNPDWVTTALEHRQLFSDEPCAPYAAAVLNGDTSTVDYLCEQLGVIKASWFLRELVLAQVREVTKLGHALFKERIPMLISLIEGNRVLRDRGLILILDKYASVAQPAIDEPLKNIAVEWWGNPWLPSNEMRWGGVLPKAREMVAEWLKREFIEAFFTKLAEGGVGDRRRANFWLRYAKSMDNIQFALGPLALYSTDRDFVALRKKMKGLYTELKSTGGANNAFVMTMGPLVAVEFGSKANALYGYDKRKAPPFDMAKPVVTAVDSHNSLKHSERIIWMQHQDGIKGWDKWEEMFEATLKQQFDIRPNIVPERTSARPKAPPVQAGARSPTEVREKLELPPYAPHSAPSSASSAESSGYSMIALAVLAKEKNFTIDDRSRKNGNLWVRTDDRDLYVNEVLLKWNFRYRAGKGWWR
jgi:hypothetical protein